MNKEARSRLRRVVIKARGLLEEDAKTQLKRLGIEEGGRPAPLDMLSHLREDDKELRRRALFAIDKEQGEKIKRDEAYNRYIRHVGFTYLNRFAALRAMEARELLRYETIIRQDHYAGLSERGYELSEREGISDIEEITHRSLLEAFSEVSSEINVLFDLGDEYSLLFPSFRTLDEVLELLSVEVPEEDWREDDVIGWIYQYYNSEARSEFKKKKRKPRADDIPVINQFYTPRWLVRALVDNTLGRHWLEMKGRMPKPGEAEPPSEERLRNPQGETVDEYCSYLLPPRQDPPPREVKCVREVKVLDPACGSGHFLVYAFNVLFRMYLEDEPETPREEIPQLILENNLFGIDIDLRSVQLAALSLYLKAKEYSPSVKIERMNLVCADARILDGDLKKGFLKSLEPDVDLQRLFAKLFEELEYTYDIGSLLKVREPFERLLRERGPTQARWHIRPKGQAFFSKKGELSAQAEMSPVGGKEVVPVKPAVTLGEMLEALEIFEREGMEKKDMGTMLFAAEAEKSVGLLSLLSQRYDVVVMNPPYGDMPENTKKYAKEHYPRTHYDYYAAFIEQAVDLSEDNGFIGMLTGRTFMFLKWFEKIRTEILLKEARCEVVFDLNSTPGDNILDEATARWAATVARKINYENEKMECVFVRLTLFEGEERKINSFNNALISWYLKGQNTIFYPVRLGSLRKLPRMPYSYWVPESLAGLFEKYTPLDRDNADRPDKPKIASLRVGLQTGYDGRFVRYWWEVNPNKIASSREETLQAKKWVPFVKGGDAYYSDIPLVVNWFNDGEEIRKFEKSVIRNESFYFKSGLCWSGIVSSVLIDSRPIQKGVIFSVKAHGIFPQESENLDELFAYINSSLAAFLFMTLNPTMHDRTPGYMAQLPISKKLKTPLLSSLANEANSILKEWKTGDETATIFLEPWINQTLHDSNIRHHIIHPLADNFIWSNYPSCEEFRSIKGSQDALISELAGLCEEREKRMISRLNEIQREIDEIQYDIFDISKRDKKIIERELRLLRGISKTHKNNSEEEIKPKISKEEHVTRLLSYYGKLSLEQDSDGIITLNDMFAKVRHYITEDFGEKQLERIENDIDDILGIGIKDWLSSDFFKFHVGQYKRRPIFWHLTSVNFSRKKRSKGTFDCFLYYPKLDRDTIPKIRTRQEYLKGVLNGVRWKSERLRRELQAIRESGDRSAERRLQEEYEEAMDEYSELQAFDQKLAEVSSPREMPSELADGARWLERKLAEVRDNGWSPILDYGVRVNIEPLKEARLLHKAADRVK